ncbi:MAG: carboxypeptidase regulatory-like domain-containing protein [Bacteroidetes bacterium]|nr:carboxypeptidase regulatory-like domain-containing protein [Bacteroidota bacterium]
MLRKLLSTLSVVVVSVGLTIAQNESSIRVKLTDKANKETIPFANVVVDMGGIQAGVGTTNIDGEVVIKPLNPGKYTVKATYVGYQSVEMKDVNVSIGKTVYLNIEMAAGQQLDIVEVIEYAEPLIDPDTKSGGTVTREEYQNMASKDINSVASTTAGIYQKDEGGELNVRGSRSNATAYYVDGQKVIGSAGVPQSGVEQITSITGGTPAEYGDATGGIIAITTRGPASKYTGGIEVVTSGAGEKDGKNRGLDAYGYNLLGFSINGPILMKKDSANNINKSVLGFSLSGQVVSEKDPDPSAVGFYQVNPDKLAELEAAPLRPSPQGAGFVLNSEYVRMEDLQKIKARNNVGQKAISLAGKVQYQPTANMGITIGGSMDWKKYHDFIYEYALFNPVNNSEITKNTWRVYAKLTQKFNSATATEEEKSSSVIKNAYFTLQAGYEKTFQKTQDDNHKDKLFDYGYIGKFTQTKEKTYAGETRWDYDVDGDNIKDTINAFFMQGFENTSLTYTPGDVNPTGTPYTNQYFELYSASTITDVQSGLGLANGDRPRNVYSAWFNTGRQSNLYGLEDQTQFRVFANFSADIKRHAIQMGFEYEQRVKRAYNINPIGLWTRMRELANFHIQDLKDDSINDAILNTDVHYLPDGSINPFTFYDFDRFNDANSQTQFDKSLREALGYNVGGTDWLDVDSYDKDMYNIDMFSADDLLNIGGTQLVAYYGYDHTGKKTSGNPSLDDFFTKTDDKGNLTRDIGAYRPIYVAGYIQDRFDFKDIKFNVGVRIDRFDANQKVLKDKYLLYEAKTAGELAIPNRPGNIGDDYVVYVEDGDNPSVNQVVGYRDGDTWYNAAGVEVADPSAALGQGAGQVQPYLVDPGNTKISSNVFKDYVPQLNIMPRIAFSFPISDVANFYAHYDVLTQRPPEYNRLDPMQYLNVVNNSAGFVNNPDLKPEKSIDYEIGYQQVLNEKKNSSIHLSLFYIEKKDMIQTTRVVQAYPVSYNSFSNVDFGTIKGLSLAYDLRRTAMGVSMTANYTLQFADGTGSSTTDGQNLVSSGVPNLRTTHPLDFDQRHTITLNVDYRFGAKTDYRGPRLKLHKGKDNEKVINVLENVGANVVFRAGSGTPYSKQSNITHEGQFGIGGTNTALEGQINGSSLPWTYKMDLRVDKNMELAFGGKKEGEEKKTANLTIYLQVLNVFNTKNVLGVYRATGNPGDDGYLTSAAAQTTIAGQNDPQSFSDLYTVKINNPNNYSRPRVIRIGLLLDF